MSTHPDYIFSNAHAFKPDILVESLVILPDAEKNRLLGLLPDETMKKFIFVKLCEKLLQDGLTMENLFWLDCTLTEYCTELAAITSDAQREVGKQNLITIIMQIESLALANYTAQNPNVAAELQHILTEKLQLLAKSDLSFDAQKRLEQILKFNNELSSLAEKLNHIIDTYDKISPRNPPLGKALFSIKEELELELKAYNRAHQAPVFHTTSNLTNLPISQFLNALLLANNQQRKAMLGEELASGQHAEAIKKYNEQTQFNIEHTREFLAKAICQKPEPNAEDINWLHDYLESVRREKGSLIAWNMILDMRLDTCYFRHRSPGLERLDHMLFSFQNHLQVPQQHWNLFKPQPQIKPIDPSYKTIEEHILDKLQERLSLCDTPQKFDAEIETFEHTGYAIKIHQQLEYEERYQELLSNSAQRFDLPKTAEPNVEDHLGASNTPSKKT